MDKINNTYFPDKKCCEEKQHTWYLIDAKNHKVGRIATEIARILTGKNKSIYTPYRNTKNHVIIINSKHVVMSSADEKIYFRNSRRPGGLKKESFNQLKLRLPNRIIEHAVKGMLPKNKLGRVLFNNFKVYSSNFHPHIAQTPIEYKLNEIE
uniref:ribosomal protein L13 n=1 Tax=Galdieria phlegrea TaxID=1389228 RepID=UPI0023D8BFCB|nr:ribosomal protein L13 [Galdieria phlegrea]UNJ16237.1 ribosomal protein L13 [Galdieria sp.]WDA99711.1 ribosomal protein L13 [Galdieria sulphuraria]WDA99903.1 ribosomal protein L13 [Galdieria phlegrea]